MSHRLRFHSEASRELLSFYNFIADESGEDRAWNYVSGIRDFCHDLALFPKRGTARDGTVPGLRIIGYKQSASIAFVADEAEVIILGVFYGGRNILVDDPQRRIEGN